MIGAHAFQFYTEHAHPLTDKDSELFVGHLLRWQNSSSSAEVHLCVMMKEDAGDDAQNPIAAARQSSATEN